MPARTYETVQVAREDGVAWVTLHRPEKMNAMNPQMCFDMVDVLTDLEYDSETQVLVLTGSGKAFSAGMDLKEYFRDLDDDPAGKARARAANREWTLNRLRRFPKVTIAAVNGLCFGGAFTPLISCDLAVAAEEATFGLSEVNWGVIPAGLVARDVAMVMGYREALYYILTGKPFSAARAREAGLVNEVVPLAQLRETVTELAQHLCKLNPHVLRSAKEAFKTALTMDFDQARDYLEAKGDQLLLRDSENGKGKGLKQFLEDKSYKPGQGAYDRTR